VADDPRCPPPIGSHTGELRTDLRACRADVVFPGGWTASGGRQRSMEAGLGGSKHERPAVAGRFTQSDAPHSAASCDQQEPAGVLLGKPASSWPAASGGRCGSPGWAPSPGSIAAKAAPARRCAGAGVGWGSPAGAATPESAAPCGQWPHQSRFEIGLRAQGTSAGGRKRLQACTNGRSRSSGDPGQDSLFFAGRALASPHSTSSTALRRRRLPRRTPTGAVRNKRRPTQFQQRLGPPIQDSSFDQHTAQALKPWQAGIASWPRAMAACQGGSGFRAASFALRSNAFLRSRPPCGKPAGSRRWPMTPVAGNGQRRSVGRRRPGPRPHRGGVRPTGRARHSFQPCGRGNQGHSCQTRRRRRAPRYSGGGGNRLVDGGEHWAASLHSSGIAAGEPSAAGMAAGKLFAQWPG